MTKNAQEWLNTTYQDKKVNKIGLYEKNKEAGEELIDELIIEGYTKVEEIDFRRWDFPDNKLTKIDVSKIPNLTRLNVARNPSLIEVEGLENLTKLESINLLDTPGLNGKKPKKSDFEELQAQLNKVKGLLGLNNSDSLPSVDTELQAKPAAGGSGSGVTLNSEQQEKLNKYDKLRKWADEEEKVIELAEDILTHSDVAANKLTGVLEIKDYLDLEEIELDDNELDEVVFINCPKLKKINLSKNKKTGGTGGIKKIDLNKLKVNTASEAEDNILEELMVGENDLDKIALAHCVALQKLYIQKNPNLDELNGLENLKKTQILNKDGDTKISPIHSDKLDYYKEVVKVVRETAGIDEKNPLPIDSSGKLNKDELKDKIKAGANSQLTSERDAAKQEAKEAKDKLTGLGLGDSADQQKLLEEIKKLKGRPTSSCTHTDYDTVKSERDNLRTDVESKKRKISELENGFQISDDQKQKLQNASSANDVQEVRSEIIKTEFSKLKDKNSSSTTLSVGLGVLAIGSLLTLGWVLMKQNNNLPQVEPEKEKNK
ncbi:4239_t:CDS:2 [Funneliformis geosporum]|uniref:4239_t:CDS:1 n=1 Tax=Funneliformis geosporum TaxID=1117311 RepID=A0A9W4SUT9_9GLOM|nr:4239_t:CDS:2 [Funneliformis geosporum]